MPNNNDGGPAFPVNYISMDSCGNERVQAQDFGMSLRDYFAAKALTGMLSYSINNQYNQANGTPEDIATGAYAFADAMLEAREK